MTVIGLGIEGIDLVHFLDYFLELFVSQSGPVSHFTERFNIFLRRFYVVR